MLNLPSRTKELLEKNSAYYAFALSSISSLQPWLADNKTVFFQDYTDHGFTHLNEVLLTADSIISDDSWPQLTPQDAAAMIVSVVLHDCAMHLSEDGFYTLIEGRYPNISSRYLKDEIAWSALWQDFMAEAKRFDAKKLFSLFGNTDPVKDIPDDKLYLTARDKLLVGEFIRRHHARLAHEIAFNGVPGCQAETLRLGMAPESHFLDLCGFIARSHNMSLRAAVDKLEDQKKQVHLSVHVPFLMLVLRIADYIQIHSSRAPDKLLSIKGLVSPISRGEWKKHSSIVEINHAHTDPEAIYIDAEPKDALTFVSLVSLFKDIQKELDYSWSVLGEVYGRYGPLANLGINIRRIRSSLDNVEDFFRVKRPSYIPRILRFRTADSEMMGLLIDPLYGSRPEVGIRELMQNAIDACIELGDLIIKQQLKPDAGEREEIQITLVDKGALGGEVIIQDFGIGMSLDVVENYFLNVGASFRNSDRWKKDHETNGHSNVYRTGRFGIGLLAAYLLGNKLCVTTRRAGEPEVSALTFECGRSGGDIVISNINASVGTRISIEVSKEVVSHLRNKKDEWDWYCLESPRVVRRIVSGDKEEVLKQSRVVPGSDSELPQNGWFRTEAKGFDAVFWTYNKIKDSYRHYGEWRSLVCNGIAITDHFTLSSLIVSSPMRYIEVAVPSLVVFDQDGRLPINLQRTDLVGEILPFQEEFLSDLCDKLVGDLVGFCKGLDSSDFRSFAEALNNVSLESLGRSHHSSNESVSKLIIGVDGSLLPLDYSLVAKAKIKTISIDAANFSKGQGAWSSVEFMRVRSSYLAVDGISSTKQSRSYWVRVFFELQQSYRERGVAALPIVGRRIIIRKVDVPVIVAPGYVPKTFWNRLHLEWENETWTLYSIGSVPELDFEPEKMSREFEDGSSFGAIFCYLNWDEAKGDAGNEAEEGSQFSKAWLASVGTPWLVVS